MYRELLIGCGTNRVKKLRPRGHEGWSELTTLDFNPDCQPNVEWNLEELPYPFTDDRFDEIHAYEVLEHTGRQGDFRFFFAQFSELYRILKPGGLLLGSSPALHDRWLWGDPGHTRVIAAESLIYLNQDEYNRQVGETAMTDYRRWFRGDFEAPTMEMLAFVNPDVPRDHPTLFIYDNTFWFVLRAIKPSRILA